MEGGLHVVVDRARLHGRQVYWVTISCDQCSPRCMRAAVFRRPPGRDRGSMELRFRGCDRVFVLAWRKTYRGGTAFRAYYA